MDRPPDLKLTANSRTALDILLWLTEDAFDGDPDHSLLANLRNLQDEEWTRIPQSGTRTVADVLEHVG